MKFIPSLFAALAVLCIVPGCKKAPEDKTEATATATPTPDDPRATPIGFLASFTGAQASFGQDAVNGANLAIEEINAAGGVLGRPLKLVVKDTRSSNEETAAATSLLLEKSPVVIGEIASDRTLAAAPLAQAAGVPLITPASTNDTVTAAGDFIFRVCYTDSFQAEAMAKFARSIDVTKAAILSDPASQYSSGLAGAFKLDFTKGGGTIVAEATYRAGDRDFAAQLNAIKAAAPEVVFLPSYYAEAALIIRQARELGLDLPFIGTDGWDSTDFLKVGGTAVDNTYFFSHFSPENRTPGADQFTASYTARFNAPPPPLAALNYDAVMLAADAMKRAGSLERNAIRDALAGTSDFPGVTGRIAFDQQRNPRKSGLILRVDGGKFTYLETIEPPAPTP